jgi:hypothetical protein
VREIPPVDRGLRDEEGWNAGHEWKRIFEVGKIGRAQRERRDDNRPCDGEEFAVPRSSLFTQRGERDLYRGRDSQGFGRVRIRIEEM